MLVNEWMNCVEPSAYWQDKVLMCWRHFWRIGARSLTLLIFPVVWYMYVVTIVHCYCSHFFPISVSSPSEFRQLPRNILTKHFAPHFLLSHNHLMKCLSYINPLCIQTGQRMRVLCIRRNLCRNVTIGTPMVILTVFDNWYTFGTVLVDLWRLVHQWLFLLFWLSFDCFWRLVHCWYSLGRHVMIGTPIVIFAIPTVYQSSKHSQNSKNDRWCTNRHMSTNSVPIVEKQQKLSWVYQSSHVYTESAEYTKSASTEYTKPKYSVQMRSTLNSGSFHFLD